MLFIYVCLPPGAVPHHMAFFVTFQALPLRLAIVNYWLSDTL